MGPSLLLMVDSVPDWGRVTYYVPSTVLGAGDRRTENEIIPTYKGRLTRAYLKAYRQCACELGDCGQVTNHLRPRVL